MDDTIQSTGRSAFTVAEFCQRNGISRGLYYKLDKAGLGPRYLTVGINADQHRRITVEAEQEWLREREAAAAAKKAAKTSPTTVVEAAA